MLTDYQNRLCGEFKSEMGPHSHHWVQIGADVSGRYRYCSLCFARSHFPVGLGVAPLRQDWLDGGAWLIPAGEQVAQPVLVPKRRYKPRKRKLTPGKDRSER